jgi:ABC-type transporter Mla MlaB component
MASPSDGNNDGVLRKMVKLMAAPARDLMGRGGDSGASQFADVERAELKAMIERKRRNDFVRKRELDMLRRIRREGLSAEQAASLNATSRLDDSEVKATQPPGTGDPGVKAKIDAIERQMVGSAVPAQGRRGPPAHLGVTPPTLTSQVVDPDATVPADLGAEGNEGALTQPMSILPDQQIFKVEDSVPAVTAVAPVSLVSPAQAVAPAAQGTALPPMEVQEIAHDHELDEAVIAFANADFSHCERALLQLTSPAGVRQNHSETWLVLFDLYRATGQHARFEALAMDYPQRFQRSPPQWYSLPKLVADATQSTAARNPDAGDVGWLCPAHLDADGVAQLASRTLQLPQPWVLDWTHLQRLDPDAAAHLRVQLRRWADQVLEMRWLAADRLFAVLQDAAPVGVRDADPAYWLARLEALRLVNRPDQFDEVAIDYCVTYEVSPPSWEATRCAARVGGSQQNTQNADLSVLGEAITTLQGASDGAGSLAVTSLELSGQLSGDISALLASMDRRLGDARVVRISCALLIRVDFIAAGDLLNWVIAKRAQGRPVSFTDVHRLVALMFGAMGITEHAPVSLRQA